MNRSKSKGTDWESKIVDYLSRWWPHVERRAQSGANDKGDIAGIIGCAIEAKACATWAPQQWLRELDAEMVNATADTGCVWAKVRGKGQAVDGIILMRPDMFVALLRAAGY